MKFGFHLPHFGPLANTETLVKVAQRAEQLGYDSIWVLDHVIMPKVHADKFSSNVYEPLTVLSFIAALTKRIKLGTSVVILPMRNPIELAKRLSTLDVLCAGRLIIGLGAGWMKEEFDILSAPFEDRGVRADEYIKIMKELWTNPNPEFQGQTFMFSNLKFEPKPTQKPHPPIWIGGTSRRAIRRAVELGDGWHPVGLSISELAEGIRHLKTVCQKVARNEKEIEISVRLRLTFEEDETARARNGLVGSPVYMLDLIKAHEKLGVSTMLVDSSFSFVPLDEQLETLERFSREVINKIK